MGRKMLLLNERGWCLTLYCGTKGSGRYERQAIRQGPSHEETVEGTASLPLENQMATRAPTASG